MFIELLGCYSYRSEQRHPAHLNLLSLKLNTLTYTICIVLCPRKKHQLETLRPQGTQATSEPSRELGCHPSPFGSFNDPITLLFLFNRHPWPVMSKPTWDRYGVRCASKLLTRTFTLAPTQAYYLPVSKNKWAQTCLTRVCTTKLQWGIPLPIHPEPREMIAALTHQSQTATQPRLPVSQFLLKWHLVTHSPWCTTDGLGCPYACPEELHCNKLGFNACQLTVLLAITWELLPCDLMRMVPKWSCNNFLEGLRMISLP